MAHCPVTTTPVSACNEYIATWILTHIKGKEQTRWLWPAIWKRASHERLYIQRVIDVNTKSFFCEIFRSSSNQCTSSDEIHRSLQRFAISLADIWRPSTCLSNFFSVNKILEIFDRISGRMAYHRKWARLGGCKPVEFFLDSSLNIYCLGNPKHAFDSIVIIAYYIK